MTPRLLIIILLAAFVITLFLVGEPLAEHDGTSPVKQVQVVTWGRESPPYVIASDMFTTTTQPRARTAPSKRTVMRAASAGPAVLEGSVNGYPCGGSDLPPCYVMRRESGGNPNAYNAHGCNGHGCFGLWQFSGAWACHFGLSCDIAHWTPEEQTYAARTLWDHGAGCRAWAAC